MLRAQDEDHVVQTVIERVTARVVAQAGSPGGQPLEEVVTQTLIDERGRLEHANGPRADGDRAFYADLQHELARVDSGRMYALVRSVVTHYAGEIRGHFDPRVYAFATRALPVGLTVLLNGMSPARVLAHRHEMLNLSDHVLIEGEVATLRALAEIGTVVLVPTHTSNLDSLLFGNSIFRMGLPPFSYGAGLNLFTNRLTGFFMRHLGAYTVDRQKKDPLYREILKEFATVLLEEGQHNFFFPGGTRSRSGAVEAHLKKGLLGTGIAAFRNNLLQGRRKPRVFFVPATASYPLVLEAQSLIADFLEESGRSRYVPMEDEFNLVQRWVDFLGGLLRMDLRVELVIGKPLDPFGDDVDDEGTSHDPHGRPIDPSRYLLVDGTVARDDARDAEYTRMLAARIVAAYRSDNVALPTGVLAFAVLELLRARWPRLDVYRLLRQLGPDTGIPVAAVQQEVDLLLAELRALHGHGAIRLSPEAQDGAAVVQRGLETFRTYHATPVLERRGDRIFASNPNLLFYYRNRLEGYGLRGEEPMFPLRSDP
jgi:glycerol-3-phosphate O-acyltransferase